jgi:hypothetical protein
MMCDLSYANIKYLNDHHFLPINTDLNGLYT